MAQVDVRPAAAVGKSAVDSFGKIETHGIDYIPDEDRHSNPMNIFWILIGANLTFGLIVLGALPVSFGLSWWSRSRRSSWVISSGHCYSPRWH